MSDPLYQYLSRIYQFGTKKDANSANAMASDMKKVIYETCYTDKGENDGGNDSGKKAIIKKKINNTQFGEKYTALVESGNEYINNLLTTESTYFINKYGVDIYKVLLSDRLTYLDGLKNSPTFQIDVTYNAIIDSINILNQDLSGSTYAMNTLNTYLPSFDTNSIYREIEYRDNEYKNLQQVNNYINISYYIGFIILLVLLYSSDNLFLKERGLLYLILVLLPFIYPWLFVFSKKLIPSFSYNGPVNAFLDTNTNTTTSFSNNQTNDYKKRVNTTTLS